jgi:predicted DNA-binding transcriptional regulator AlpA
MSKKLSKNASALSVDEEVRRRWVRNVELAKYLGVSKMTLWRFQQDPSFPSPSVRNGIAFNDLNKIDEWMEQAVVAL